MVFVPGRVFFGDSTVMVSDTFLVNPSILAQGSTSSDSFFECLVHGKLKMSFSMKPSTYALSYGTPGSSFHLDRSDAACSLANPSNLTESNVNKSPDKMGRITRTGYEPSFSPRNWRIGSPTTGLRYPRGLYKSRFTKSMTQVNRAPEKFSFV